ncbi:hypothetical protein [Bacillus sp. AK128]
MVQEGKVTYKEHEELEDQYEISYEKNEDLQLTYIGTEENLGQVVEYFTETSAGEVKASEGEVIDIQKEFSLSGGTGGTSHIPKDLNFSPIDKQDHVFKVTIKWNDKIEEIELTYQD